MQYSGIVTGIYPRWNYPSTQSNLFFTTYRCMLSLLHPHLPACAAALPQLRRHPWLLDQQQLRQRRLMEALHSLRLLWPQQRLRCPNRHRHQRPHWGYHSTTYLQVAPLSYLPSSTFRLALMSMRTSWATSLEYTLINPAATLEVKAFNTRRDIW